MVILALQSLILARKCSQDINGAQGYRYCSFGERNVSAAHNFDGELSRKRNDVNWIRHEIRGTPTDRRLQQPRFVQGTRTKQTLMILV